MYPILTATCTSIVRAGVRDVSRPFSTGHRPCEVRCDVRNGLVDEILAREFATVTHGSVRRCWVLVRRGGGCRRSVG